MHPLLPCLLDTARRASSLTSYPPPHGTCRSESAMFWFPDQNSTVRFLKRSSIASAALCCKADRAVVDCSAIRAEFLRHTRFAIARHCNTPAFVRPPPRIAKQDPLSFLRACSSCPGVLRPNRVRLLSDQLLGSARPHAT